MSDGLPPGSSRPKVRADEGSVFTARDINIRKAGSMNFAATVNRGSHPSGNACQQVRDADYIVTGGSVVNTDKITCDSVDGDMNFSVTVTSHQVPHQVPQVPQVPAGAVGGTLPSSEDPAVKMIREHKLALIRHLSADHSFILQHVHAKEILNDRQYRNVKSISQPEKMVTQLIDEVISKGEDYCSLFLDILKMPDVLSTYPQLRGIMSKWR